MRFLWIPLSWLLITLSMAVPQVLLALSGSRVLAFGGGVLLLGLLGLVLLRSASTSQQAFVGLGMVAVGVLIVAIPVTPTMQTAVRLSWGQALDGVSLAEALERGEEGTWIRLTDARVRSESTHTFHFVRGDPKRGQTRTRMEVAPVSLASEVSNENPVMRVRPRGENVLWACSESMGFISKWDQERQAVRGRLGRMEEHVLESLSGELSPKVAKSSPGAWAIPAAPGAPSTPSPTLSRTPELSVAQAPWCVVLDPALSAEAARTEALGWSMLVLLFVPLGGLMVLAITFSGSEKSRSSNP
ncbi:hypothetical protein P2318_13230 [Myxococcaceae bacterium GXIMD 01537]